MEEKDQTRKNQRSVESKEYLEIALSDERESTNSWYNSSEKNLEKFSKKGKKGKKAKKKKKNFRRNKSLTPNPKNFHRFDNSMKYIKNTPNGLMKMKRHLTPKHTPIKKINSFQCKSSS